MVFKYYEKLTFVICNLTFLLASMKSLTNSLVAGKIHVNLMSKTAFGKIFQDHRRVPVNVFNVKIATSEHLKRVTGRICRN